MSPDVLSTNPGTGDEKSDSPLPPQAEEIIKELHDVADDALSSLPLIFFKMLNTSFEASPPVIVDEFEDDIVVGAPQSPLRSYTYAFPYQLSY